MCELKAALVQIPVVFVKLPVGHVELPHLVFWYSDVFYYCFFIATNQFLCPKTSSESCPLLDIVQRKSFKISLRLFSACRHDEDIVRSGQFQTWSNWIHSHFSFLNVGKRIMFTRPKNVTQAF